MTMHPKFAQSIKNQLSSALISRDPFLIAAAIGVPIAALSSPYAAKVDLSSSAIHNKNPKNTSLTLQDPSGLEWGTALASLIQAYEAIAKKDVIRCYEAQSSFHSAFNHIFGVSTGNILVPALHVACRNTHRIALLADRKQVEDGGPNDHARLQSAVTTLQESFSKTLNDRKELPSQMNSMIPSFTEDGSKKVGVLYIVNQLFSMYFQLNTLRLCKNLVKPVESRKLHEQGVIGELVTYKYYVGRLYLLEDQYEAAEENLDYAFLHCHKKAMGNKRQILYYLLPVKLLRGRLPTDQLLEKYNLIEFKPLVVGLRRGDLRTFNSALEKYMNLFIRVGTYLLLEKCKTICYRNLFKRVYTIMDKTQLPLSCVERSFQWLGMPMDLDEIECILANLIFRGFVRGYIYHEKRVLVLSKKEPFPKIIDKMV